MNYKKIKTNLEQRLEDIEKKCAAFETTTDGSHGACYHFNKYHKVKTLLDNINKKKLGRALES